MADAFIPGLGLAREFYATVVRALLDDEFPGVPYAAALLGPAARFAAALREAVTDPRIRQLPATGAIDQFTDSTDAAGDLRLLRACADAAIANQHPAVPHHPVLIRREAAPDAGAIRPITAAAFARPGLPPGEDPPETSLLDERRAGPAWLPELSMVAVRAGEVIGHVLCTRGHVGRSPVLALGPPTVRPDSQRRGVGSILMHAVLGAADALGEPLVALLGDPAYSRRFGFRPGTDHQITPPKPHWQPHFQVRTLAGYLPSVRGTFSYPEPFDQI